MPAEVESIAWRRQDGPPWHNLGVPVEGALTAQEMVKAAGLDWMVEKRPLAVHGYDGSWIPVLGKVGIVRDTDQATLGVVGEHYTPMQNQDAFALFDAVTASGEAKYITAGSLKGGRKVWALAELPKSIHIAGVDEIKPYLLLANGHDGWTAVNMLTTPTRVVCWNTLTLAMSRATNRISLRHTVHMMERVDQARTALGIAVKYYQTFEEMGNLLVSKRVNTRQIRDVLSAVIPDKTEEESGAVVRLRRQAIVDLMDAPTNSMEGIRGTAWSLLNAGVEFSDWYATKYRTDENRIASVWFGKAQEFNQRLLQKVQEVAF